MTGENRAEAAFVHNAPQSKALSGETFCPSIEFPGADDGIDARVVFRVQLRHAVGNHQTLDCEVSVQKGKHDVAASSLKSPVHVRRTVESVPGGVIAAPIPAMPYRDRGTPF